MLSWIKRHASKFSKKSDGVLIKKAQAGDRNAFGNLYLKYLDAIYRYVFFRVNFNTPDAEDITELVFQKAWENLGTFKNKDGNFKAWIYRIAHNTVLDHYKKQRTTKLDEYIEDASESLEEIIGNKMKTQAILVALDTLSDEQKQVVTMRFMEEMSHKEIAHILEKKEDAIRALQYRALKQLRELLKTYEEYR